MHARPGAAPPWGSHLADSQTPPISYKLASLWLRVKLLPQPHPQRCQLFCAALSFLPKDPLVPHPQRPALGGSSLLPSPCLQHPVLCLPALTMEGIGYETNKKTKLDICNICLSEPVGVAQPSEAWLGRPARGHRHRPLPWWLAMLLSCFLFSFSFFFSFF